ncbi:Uncharacterised protein [uncultured Avibacterium sp.]|uniref:Uncharacterized protein n=1 Tax=uncultured Avibacterium sp. TaxID=1936169 RepID=A0A486XGC7_9PAST|nr:Uncharacterised protein [uncultured Avibacterium sp.]
MERFIISYDASDEEYSEHKIDAHNLIKIVQDMINLVERSDKLLNGKQKTVDIYVQAFDTKQIVREGSIQFPFSLETFEYVMQAKKMVTSMDTVDVLATLGIIPGGAMGYGLFKNILKTNGEPVIDIKTQDDSDEVIVLTENTKTVTNENVAVLMQDSKIRESVKDLVVAPLINKDNGVFKIIRSDHVIDEDTQEEKIEEDVVLSVKPKQQIETFSNLTENIYPDPEESETEEMIVITQLNFYSGKSGWKMKLNDKERAVELQDIEFINKINANQASFRKGDWLKVSLKTIKTFGNTTKTSYIITEVLDHLVNPDRKLTDNDDE